jgi:protein TonB
VAGGEGVIPPAILSQEQPKFPRAAERMRVSGVVNLQVLVGVDGRVEEVRIVNVSRSGVGFESASEEAVRKWRYRPATKDGVKVRMWLPVRIPFTIK